MAADPTRNTAQVTGMPREALIGTDFANYFTEPEKARQGYEQVFAQGCVRDYPLAIRHVSGQITDVLYNATLFKNEAGEVEGGFAAARDVSERKRAEEQLRNASLYARSLIEAQRLCRATRGLLPGVTASTLAIHAMEDDMSSPRNAEYLIRRIASRHSRYVALRDSYHMITLDREKGRVLAETRDFLARVADDGSTQAIPRDNVYPITQSK